MCATQRCRHCCRLSNHTLDVFFVFFIFACATSFSVDCRLQHILDLTQRSNSAGRLLRIQAKATKRAPCFLFPVPRDGLYLLETSWQEQEYIRTSKYVQCVTARFGCHDTTLGLEQRHTHAHTKHTARPTVLVAGSVFALLPPLTLSTAVPPLRGYRWRRRGQESLRKVSVGSDSFRRVLEVVEARRSIVTLWAKTRTRSEGTRQKPGGNIEKKEQKQKKHELAGQREKNTGCIVSVSVSTLQRAMRCQFREDCGHSAQGTCRACLLRTKFHYSWTTSVQRVTTSFQGGS